MTIVRYFAPGGIERHVVVIVLMLLVTAGMLAWTMRLG